MGAAASTSGLTAETMAVLATLPEEAQAELKALAATLPAKAGKPFLRTPFPAGDEPVALLFGRFADKDRKLDTAALEKLTRAFAEISPCSLKALFTTYDADRSGRLDLKEFRNLLKALKSSKAQLVKPVGKPRPYDGLTQARIGKPRPFSGGFAKASPC